MLVMTQIHKFAEMVMGCHKKGHGYEYNWDALLHVWVQTLKDAPSNGMDDLREYLNGDLDNMGCKPVMQDELANDSNWHTSGLASKVKL